VPAWPADWVRRRGTLVPAGSIFWPVLALALLGLGLVVHGLRRLLVRRPAGSGRTAVLASLLVVARNSQDVIEGVLRDLIARYGWWPETGPGFEVVVVDVGSTDDTPAILRRLVRSAAGFIQVVRLEDWTYGVERGPDDALTVGLPLCRGRTIRVIDLDRPRTDKAGGSTWVNGGPSPAAPVAPVASTGKRISVSGRES
jgi:hypothetical protein